MKPRIAVLVGAAILIVQPVRVIPAATEADVTRDRVEIDFPTNAVFSATVTADEPITEVVLEYGSRQLSCAEVVAKAYPQFVSESTVEVSWTWDMRQSGSLPPGARLWWRWRFSDASGREQVGPIRDAAWIDDQHEWRTYEGGEFVRLHSYDPDVSIPQQLTVAAREGLLYSETHAGLRPQAPIDIFIYSSNADMREAILFEPSWTGGLAFPEHDVVILGVSSSELAWGKLAIVHELTHVLVGHLTFSCLAVVPTWLNEGLAVYSEGGLDSDSQAQLEAAIQGDTLLSLRALSSGFSEASSRAELSYSESYSVVSYLIDSHGQGRID
jgi:hypothetical protein